MSDICGVGVPHRHLVGPFACLRAAGHVGEHVALARDAAAADAAHGRDCPSPRCTLCLAVVPQRITLDGARILVDGKDSGRMLDHERVITARKTRKR